MAKSPGGVAKPNLPQAAAVPVTPVRVKATYTASAATPTKYSTHDPPPSRATPPVGRATPPVGVATYPVGVSTPNTQRRTIWDMDSEMPTAGGPAVVQCSKSNPVTPQVAKKIELPPRAPPMVVPLASAFSAAAAPPPPHNGAFSRVFGSVIHDFHLISSGRTKSELHLLLPLGKWGSKWGDFHWAMGYV